VTIVHTSVDDILHATNGLTRYVERRLVDTRVILENSTRTACASNTRDVS